MIDRNCCIELDHTEWYSDSSVDLYLWSAGQDTDDSDWGLFVVFLSPSKQILGRYFKWAMTDFFRILCS
jgi:hypothetical protein